MLYTEMTKKALEISFNAHKDKTDKGGMPYVYHPFHVAEQMKTEDEVIVALLHDVVEDTGMTIEDLRAKGFSEEVLSALRLLTHDKSEPYMDYIERIKANPLATAVKLADLRHNSDLSRLSVVDDVARERVDKYAKAIAILSDGTVNKLRK
jgi:(p)ppGpp synthase/HD superfamily hydrolase